MKDTKERMLALVEEWKQSGLAKTEFCRQKNIGFQKFHYWFKRFSPGAATGFSEISVVNDARGGGHEVVFPSGVRLVLHGEPSVGWLRELVR